LTPCSPDSEDPPSWPSAAGTGLVSVPSTANSSGSGSGSGGGDVRSPSLSSDEQSSEASLITETGGGGGGTPHHPDTPDNLTLAVLDSVAGKRLAHCTGETLTVPTLVQIQCRSICSMLYVRSESIGTLWLLAEVAESGCRVHRLLKQTMTEMIRIILLGAVSSLLMGGGVCRIQVLVLSPQLISHQLQPQLCVFETQKVT